ncbi:MAG: hypothetical protein M1819_002035 [Sarea resinae]|nr:MAG: hypothetical protein M1819_002035 [Sarea resinae]
MYVILPPSDGLLIKKLSATPTLLPQNASASAHEALDPQASLQANKATFFFRLERELEKVNTFYLQKEAELQLRLQTLLEKKKVMQSRSATTSKISASFVTLEEGFQQFGNDLNKLQQFVEINATAFSKILKKWDKTSKSRTKELYLSRAVEVQPCFNRDVISHLSDQATTSLLELGAWAEGENIHFDAVSIPTTGGGQSIGADENDTDSQLLQALNGGNLSLSKDWISRFRNAPDAAARLTRAFLAAISEAPEESLHALLETKLIDLHAEDEINERNCLHEAAIAGRISVLQAGLSDGVDASRVDVYGRTPLHYACMHDRVDFIQVLVDAKPSIIDLKDHDNFTPLVHGIVHDQLSCVERLLSYRIRIEPNSDSDHVPLNLACQHGSLPIVKLLLQHHPQLLADAEGLYPQHLVARSGKNPQLLLVLQDYGADLDQLDKLYQWTPLFHAASEGHVECLQVLLECGVRADILDEKELPAMYYATWEGHLECMHLLSSIGADPGRIRRALPTQPQPPPIMIPSSRGPDPMATEPDSIPDLSLPPPIIPLRRYGHNFLDTKTCIWISFEGSGGSDAVTFYHDSKYPAARLTMSSKHSDLIPRNFLLPIPEEFKVVSFQIDNLDSFTLDFDIFPTFGSKVIARSVALPINFRALTSSSGHCCLPLFDPRLRAIGQISFNFQVIKPFQGVPLEITHFDTYWKATSQLESHQSAFITGSSLSGQYVRLFVQLTSDGVPVLNPTWKISHGGIEIPVGRLTYDQFVSIGAQHGRDNDALAALPQMGVEDSAQIHQILATSYASLHAALEYLPPNIHLDLHVLYPTAAEEQASRLEPTPNINDFADSILKCVFDQARALKEKSPEILRSIVFTSYNADICTALNWKQPNYPVLFCNDLGIDQGTWADSSAVQSSGHNSLSIKEAVRIAQSNNFMGIICASRLLRVVPALAESIKVAGLVLITDTSGDEKAQSASSSSTNTSSSSAAAAFFDMQMPEGVDGMFTPNGVLRFHETIDM